MRRSLKAPAIAAALGVVTTVAISWAFAAFGSTAGRPTGQSVLAASDHSVSFGRKDSWGLTSLYWRAVANDGGSRFGIPDDLHTLPSWSRARRLRAPFPASGEFGRQAQTFETASGWPFRAMRAEFHDYPQGTPRPPTGPYKTIRGIPLPTRRIVGPRGGALFEATALPCEPIWPGFLANSTVLGVYWLALLAGVPMARRILRSARGRCASCGYDAVGLPESAVCPECGSDLASGRTLGRRRPIVFAAATLLIVGAASGIGLSWAGARGLRIETLEPTWMLRRQARGSAPAPALAELNRRIAQKRLSAQTIGELVDDALAIQSDRAKPWSARWGDLVESAHVAGIATPDQWLAYAERALQFSMVARSPVRVGDRTPLMVTQGIRVGNGRLLGAEIKAFPPSLDGVATVMAPNPDPRRRLPQPSEAVVGGYGHPAFAPFSQPQRGWVLQPPTAIDEGSYGEIPSWPRAQRMGRSEATIELGVRIYENSYAPGPATISPARPTSTTTISERTIRLSAPVQVVEPEAAPVSLITPDDAQRRLMSQARSIDPAKAKEWAPVPCIQASVDGMVLARGGIELPGSPIALAFDVIWRRADREWTVGQFARARNEGPWTLSYSAAINDFEPGPVEILLRPSPDAARREPDIFQIWGEEVSLGSVTIDPPPAPKPGPR